MNKTKILSLVLLFSFISCVEQPVTPEEKEVVSSGEQSSVTDGRTNSLFLEAEIGDSGYFRKVSMGESIDLGGIDVIESYGTNADENTKAKEVIRNIRLVNDTKETITIKGAQSSRGVRVHGDVYYKRVYPGEKFNIPLMFDGSRERFFGETVGLQIDQGGERKLLSIPVSARVMDKFGTLKKIEDKKNGVQANTNHKSTTNIISSETQRMLDLYKYQMEQMKLQMEIMNQKKQAEGAGEAALLARLLADQQQSQREYQQQVLNLQNKLLAEQRIREAVEDRRRYEEELEKKKKIAAENFANQAIQAQLAALQAQLAQARQAVLLRQRELERVATELEKQRQREQERLLADIKDDEKKPVVGVVGTTTSSTNGTGTASTGGNTNQGGVDMNDPELEDALVEIVGGEVATIEPKTICKAGHLFIPSLKVCKRFDDPIVEMILN